jgi:DNA-binding IscR family transcriptional regulator
MTILNSSHVNVLRAVVEILLREGRDVAAAELASSLGLTRVSVHQLLLPLVRAGTLVAGRGRNGGYRAAPRAEALTLGEILAPVSRSLSAKGHVPVEPPYVAAVERRLAGALRSALDSITVGDLLAEARAASTALSWEI